MMRIRRVYSGAVRDEVFGLRYRAYLKKGSIDPSTSMRFSDKYDDQPNHVLWALWDDERLVGSLRSTWFHPGSPWSIPETDHYQDSIARTVQPSARILSANRFVTESDPRHSSSQYAMVLLKFHLTLVKSLADFNLAAIRAHHLRFYKRVMKLDPISEPKIYPGLKCMMYLTGCASRTNLDLIYRDAPQLEPTGVEAMFLDHRRRDRWERGIIIETDRDATSAHKPDKHLIDVAVGQGY